MTMMMMMMMVVVVMVVTFVVVVAVCNLISLILAPLSVFLLLRPLLDCCPCVPSSECSL